MPYRFGMNPNIFPGPGDLADCPPDDWTLTEAPTEPCGITPDQACEHEGVIPVPATVPCPDDPPWTKGEAGQCPTCSGSGVVPRTVGIIRPERECPECEAWCEALVSNALGHPRVDLPPDCTEPACDDGVIPAERVGTATVTAVPVVDGKNAGCVVGAHPLGWRAWVRTLDGLSMTEHDVTALFASPPEPGGTVWRLDKENDHE